MWKSGKRTVNIFSERKSSFLCKGLPLWYSSSLFPCFNYPSYLGCESFSITYLIPNWILYCGFLGRMFDKTHWPWSATHVLGKSNHSVGSRWAEIGWRCLPSERSRTTVCHGNGMTSIKPCDTTASLLELRVMRAPMCEIFTLTLQELNDGHPELWFWSYVDTEKGWSIRCVVQLDQQYYLQI